VKRLMRNLRDEGPIAWMLALGALVWALAFILWMVGK
jgi:hypothetical protein